MYEDVQEQKEWIHSFKKSLNEQKIVDVKMMGKKMDKRHINHMITADQDGMKKETVNLDCWILAKKETERQLSRFWDI